jgi:hypothetical protein
VTEDFNPLAFKVSTHDKSLAKGFAIGNNLTAPDIRRSVSIRPEQNPSFIAHREIQFAVMTEIETVHPVVVLVSMDSRKQYLLIVGNVITIFIGEYKYIRAA